MSVELQIMKAACGRWIILLALIVLAAPSGVTQSGRRKPPAPSASPAPETQSVAPADSAQPATGAAEARPNFHPVAIIVCGIANMKDGKSYGSSDVDYVADEIKFMFNLQKMPTKIIKAGKQIREVAVARAKQDTDTYVLWMDIEEKAVLNGTSPVAIVD